MTLSCRPRNSPSPPAPLPQNKFGGEGSKSNGLQHAADQGLVGYWAAQGNARDWSGHGHDGVLKNGDQFAPRVRGKAFQFDGFDDSISTDHSFPTDQSHAISAGVKWQGRQSYGYQQVVSCWNRAGEIPNRIFLGTTSPTRTQARIRFGDDWTNVPEPIPLGEWVYIAATYDPKRISAWFTQKGELLGTKSHTQDAHFPRSWQLAAKATMAGNTVAD